MSDKQDNIFSPSPEVTNEGEPAQEGTAFLEQLVGEGKKYGSPEELAKAYVHADAHIKTLESDVDVYKEQAAKSQTLDQALEELRKEKEAQVRPEDTTSVNTPNGLTEEQVRNILQDNENTRRREGNLVFVEKEMTKKFPGESAKKAVQEKAAELGVSVDYLQAMGAETPNVFLELFKVGTAPSTSPAPAETTVNPASSGGSGNTLYDQLNQKRISEQRRLFTPAERALLMKEAQDKGLSAVGLG